VTKETEELIKKLDVLQAEVKRLMELMSATADVREKWNIGGLLHTIQRLASEMNRDYWEQNNSNRRRSNYWHIIAQKKIDKALAESRQEKKVWDKGAD